MAAISDNGKKWIQSSVAIACMLLGYVLISFFETLGDWFALESKVPNFIATAQILSVLIALGVFAHVRAPRGAEKQCLPVQVPDPGFGPKHG